MPEVKKGSLTIVGTGHVVVRQTTPEALEHLRSADRLFYAATDEVMESWLREQNAQAVSLSDFYADGKPREDTYAEMVAAILAAVRAGERVCAAFYGHPGTGVDPSHEAVRQARAEGFDAHMLPGISAEDCLFADLGIDPLADGCLTYEATDFLLRKRPVDPGCGLVLWQIGVVGVNDYRSEQLWSRRGLEVLAEELLRVYPESHECVVYEAATVPICGPSIARMPLADLAAADVSTASTLWVPPVERAGVDPEMKARLRGA